MSPAPSGPPPGTPSPLSPRAAGVGGPVQVDVAFCPAPPLLLPAVAGTAATETRLLRAACREAVLEALAGSPELVLVAGDGPAGVRYGVGDAGSLRGFGLDLALPFAGRARPGGRSVPLPHTVGAWLLDEAGHQGVRLGVAAADLPVALAELAGLPGPVAVLAMGEGSARRSEKAPGALDPAAAGFDASVAAALAAGDPVALAALDPAEGERLLAAGVPVWRAVGTALAGRPVTARLGYDDAPFGVGYLVAAWHQR